MVQPTTSIADCFDFKAKVVKEKTLASLWAGYGTIRQVSVCNEDDGGTRSYVVKLVNPPSGAGVSHERKVKSYEVESFFYQHLATPELISRCPLPEPVFVGEADSGSHRGLMLVMSDLREGFPGGGSSLDLEHAKAGLTWLANFHAHFWEKPRPEGVWEQGTYWYLDTRLEELESTDWDWRAIKELAWEIDAELKGERRRQGSSAQAGSSGRGDGGGSGGGSDGGEKDRRFRTLVHGDFKSANLLWRQAGGGGGLPECAAVDFQYVGEGYGMRDVAYFLTAAVSARTVSQHEEALLRHYHSALTSRLTQQQAAEYTWEAALDQFEMCLLDYVRFMAGWGFWGNSTWAEAKARKYMAKRFGR